ncbi:MAG TPA: endonuclease III [Anaerolineaceae bacterium]
MADPRAAFIYPEGRLEQAAAVHARLLEFYGWPDLSQPSAPLDELVCTILSQNTNDRNRDLAYTRLRAALPTWEAVRDAPPDAVMDAIRPAGLANQKGPRIQSVLREITAERGDLSLEFLRQMPAEEAHAWLVKFNGVGPKTAAIVLVFSLGMPAFPVDTHVHRVTGRIGLRPEKMTADQAHPYLAGMFPPAEYGPAHLNIIRLGREICHARGPRCEICPVLDLCDFGRAAITGA